MSAFSTPVSAVKWCHLVQEALLVASWPDRLLSIDRCAKRTSSDGRLLFRGPAVRMGMHIGSPEMKINPITGMFFIILFYLFNYFIYYLFILFLLIISIIK